MLINLCSEYSPDKKQDAVKHHGESLSTCKAAQGLDMLCVMRLQVYTCMQVHAYACVWMYVLDKRTACQAAITRLDPTPLAERSSSVPAMPSRR